MFILNLMFGLIFALIGFIMGIIVCDINFIQPARKRTKEALDGWEESIKFSTKLLMEKVEWQTKTKKKTTAKEPSKNTTV